MRRDVKIMVCNVCERKWDVYTLRLDDYGSKDRMTQRGNACSCGNIWFRLVPLWELLDEEPPPPPRFPSFLEEFLGTAKERSRRDCKQVSDTF